MSDGVERIAAERRRQIEVEGWTPEHDDKHVHGQLAQAASCYAVATVPHYAGHYPVQWPWSPRWDKRPGPSSDVFGRIRALEKAGALIAAEIDRLLRRSEEKVQAAVDAQVAESYPHLRNGGSHVHRCMRCSEEFACRNVGACVAGYDVLPRIVEQGPDGPRVVDHCPDMQPGPAGAPEGEPC